MTLMDKEADTNTVVALAGVEKAPGKAPAARKGTHQVHDPGTEPVDDSLPPDGADIIHEQDRRAGRPLTPDHLIVQTRHQRCLELRIAGVKWIDIAKEMGYAEPGAAYKAANTARKRLGTPDESGTELRSLLYNRLNEQLQRIWPLALGGYRRDDGTIAPPSLSHMQEARAIMKDMANLMGANVPTTTNTNITGGVLHGVVGQIEHSGAIIHTEWDEERFIAEMKKSTPEGARALAAGDPELMPVIEAQVIEHEQKPPSGYIAPRHVATEWDDTQEDVKPNSTDGKEAVPVFDPRKAIEL